MELAEVVCPQVALPVVGVLVCAVLVFAFGFKSPGQPPSFDFDDKKKIRRTKQKTSRSHTGNGHVPITTEEVPSKSTTGGKSPRSISSSSSPSATSKNTSPVSNKSSPTVKQDVKKGLKKASTSKASVEETKPNVKSVQDVDDEGWMTQVSKKGKKHRGKKDETEPLDKKPTKDETIESSAPEPRETEAAPVESASPPLEKRKKKSRKTSKGTPEEGSSTGGSGEPAQAPLEEQSKEKVAAAVKIEPEPEAEPEPEPEPEPETKPESSAEQSEDVVKEGTSKPQKKSKNKKKEVGEDFEIPDVYLKSPLVEPVALPTIKPAKSPKKNKKDKKQEQQTIVDTLSEALDLEVTSNPVPASAVSQLSEAMEDIPAVPEVSPVESPTQPDPSSTAQTTENVTFDEIGDSWIEAKVKTKKKKARREN